MTDRSELSGLTRFMGDRFILTRSHGTHDISHVGEVTELATHWSLVFNQKPISQSEGSASWRRMKKQLCNHAKKPENPIERSSKSIDREIDR